ncbi:MAG: hypothetical protein FWD17_15475 [Polyangiaceae bacterium]|nr:hypothetical protein [Polyangiaceae bacterium]
MSLSSLSCNNGRLSGWAGALLAISVAVAAGCGGGGDGGGKGNLISGTLGGGSDAAAADDAAMVIHRDAAGLPEAAANVDASQPATTTQYDSTVGNPCMSDVDCQPDGGPGLNLCSLTAFQTGPLFSTPVCILPTCDPGDGTTPQFCDGPADDPSTAKGFCLPVGNGAGICLPLCAFLSDGSAPQGCQGNDTCNFIAAAQTSSGTVGIGYCSSGCAVDSDCPSGSSCDTVSGFCLTQVTPPTKNVGDPCTSADNMANPPACNCLIGADGTGYCTKYCAVDSKTATCPAGFTCDALLSTMLVDPTTDASVAGFSTPNTGLAGSCLLPCGSPAAGDASVAGAEGGAGDSDAAAGDDAGNEGGSDDAGGNAGGGDAAAGATACPGTSTCSVGETAGPHCLPQ